MFCPGCLYYGFLNVCHRCCMVLRITQIENVVCREHHFVRRNKVGCRRNLHIVHIHTEGSVYEVPGVHDCWCRYAIVLFDPNKVFPSRTDSTSNAKIILNLNKKLTKVKYCSAPLSVDKGGLCNFRNINSRLWLNLIRRFIMQFGIKLNEFPELHERSKSSLLNDFNSFPNDENNFSSIIIKCVYSPSFTLVSQNRSF